MIRLLSAGIQCNEPGKNPKALWITSAAQYAILQDRLSAHRLRPARPLAQVDFGRSAVLAVFMGQQATAGYGLTLASPHAEIEKGSLRVRLGWREPGKGRASAQVMTSPCVLLEVPRGNFARIQIMDQARQIRIELELAPAGAADPPP